MIIIIIIISDIASKVKARSLRNATCLQDLFFSLIGCALFIAAGSLNIDYFHKLAYKSSFRDTGLAKGSLSIIEGAIFLVDAFLTFRGENWVAFEHNEGLRGRRCVNHIPWLTKSSAESSLSLSISLIY